eukprot:snap_masked-scaffold409_size180341-processed-gene-0.2 protein:Tk00886 transcript:snap_masked-scaffold409_size180341-processed-gene-0.2-mRNA-1 annotation:"hypothetical protein DAPPUDRAFT_62540"
MVRYSKGGELEVVSTGWVSIALTFRGNLAGADIIVGWVSEDGVATLVDAHGDSQGRMVKDKTQDYQLIVGYQYQDSTVLRFKRKLNTCDGDDLAITNDTFRVRWSYSTVDPVGESELPTLISERQGQRAVHLYETAKIVHRQPNALKWLVASNSVILPRKHTLYWCTMLKLPEMPGKHHMIGYRPVLTPGSEKYVHHMMMYECHDTEDSFTRFHHHVNSGYECNTPNMPKDFKKCRGIVAAWGLGGEPFYLPEEAGYPVGEQHGGSTYYMLEVHYDNPGLHANIVDSSGLEVFLTPNLRKYDSGLLTVGHDVSSFQLIPPGEDAFTTVGHCPEVCTQALPQEGVNIYAGLPHTHNLGRSVRLRHLRDGQEEPVPFQDRFYDPHYQTMRRFDLKLKPRDHLITECTYNSTDLDEFTRGGFSAKNEMCLIFLHYYPATRLAHCASRLTLKHVLLALGVSVWPITPSTRHLGLRIKDPWQYQNLTFTDYLRVNGGKNRAANIRLQEASLHHSHMAECFDYGERRVYADGLEFSTPRMHNPVYDMTGGCYDDTQGNFAYDPRLNQPLHGNSQRPMGLTLAFGIVPVFSLLFIVH